MRNPRKIALISFVSFITIAILLYLFMPIKPRLAILGYRLDNGDYGFTGPYTTYTFEIESNQINAITTEDTSDITTDTDLTALFTFFDNSNYAARVIVEKDNETGVCIYTPGFDAADNALTCEDIALTQVTLDELKDQVEYHLIMIYFEFDWTYIPDYQR